MSKLHRWLLAPPLALTVAACAVYPRAPWQEWAADGHVPPWLTFSIMSAASQPRATLAVSVADGAKTPEGWHPVATNQIAAEWPVTLTGAARLIDTPERVSRSHRLSGLSYRATSEQYGKAGDLMRPAFVHGKPGWCLEDKALLRVAETACYRDDDNDGRLEYLTGPMQPNEAHPFLLMAMVDDGIYGEEGEAGSPRYERLPDHRWSAAGVVRVQFLGPVPSSVAAPAGEVQFAVGFSTAAEVLGPIHRFAAFDNAGIARTDLVPGLPDLEVRRAGDGFEVRFAGEPAGQIAYWNPAIAGGPDRDRDQLDRSLMLAFYPCAVDENDRVYRVGPERSDKDPC